MPSRPPRATGPSTNGVGRAHAHAAGLVYVCDREAGIHRIRRGDAFEYLGADGERITDPGTLQRIARLAIPPAYEDVWICADPNGHLQATGRDARARKQYRYHAEWRRLRDGAKFERMPAFGDALTRLRLRVRRDLTLPGWPREKVLALVASLLDATRMRIGNAEYERANGSFGLTTLRNRHVRFGTGGGLVLRFRGKGGARQTAVVGDRRLAQLVRRCHELPGQRLFQYVDETGEARPVDSGQVNLYLKEAMGEAFTAKDFRTWAATLRAAALLHATPPSARPTRKAHNECIVAAVKAVAAELGNTPAVCRKSYINPLVFDAWRSGALHAIMGQGPGANAHASERRVLAFLRRAATARRASPMVAVRRLRTRRTV